MPGAKTKTKPGTMVPITDRSDDGDTRNAKPKTTCVCFINGGNTVELQFPDGAIEGWAMVPKPNNTEVGLEGKLGCGNGPKFDKPHDFYLNMRSQLRLCVSAMLGHECAVNWAEVSIEDKHNIISATKQEYLYLFRFVGDWAIEAMLKQVLRNVHDTKKNKQGHRKGGNKARATKALKQNTNKEDEENVVETPPPKQRPTAKSNDKPAGKKDKGKNRAQMPEEPDQPGDGDDVGPVLTEDEEEGEEGEKEGGRGGKRDEDEESEDEEEPKAQCQKKVSTPYCS
ncbi:hypothetical protein FRC06_006060 [Ceratobasidium sp. 370]|nr:hypothetical protein FRC06_006060 [Ceratobasidium sp. 370]